MKRTVFLSIALWFLLAGATLPAGAIRRDWAFWNMLTPAARTRLSETTITLSESCSAAVVGSQYAGARYDYLADMVELCGRDAWVDEDRLRHEMLHAMDWTDPVCADWISKPGSVCRPMPASEASFVRLVPTAIQDEAAAIYQGWMRPGELWAMVPILVEWDFDALPPEVAAFYATWFVAANQ